MAKDLKSILAGVKSSKIAPPEIDDKNYYDWNAKDGVAFIKKHKIETHADRVGNGDDVYKGKTKKTDKYKFQSDGVYEETEEEVDENYMGFNALKGQLTQTGAKSPAALAAWIGRRKYGKEKFQAAAAKDKKLGETHVHNNMSENCNHTNEGVMCEVHGMKSCPKEDDVNTQKAKKKDFKGREYLADKKKCMDEGRIEDDAQRRGAKELSAIAAKSNVPVTKLKPGKKSYNQIKSTGQMFGGARTFAAGVAKRNIEAGDSHTSVTKAKVGGKLKEEIENVEEVVRIVDPVRKKLDPKHGQKDGSFQSKMERMHLAKAAKDRRKLTHGSGVSGFNSRLDPKLDKQTYKNRDQDTGSIKAVRKEEVEYIEEKLTGKDSVSKWIHDFVHSDNPKFSGKSTKERQKMALGGYYSKKRASKESGSATNTDYTGPGAAGWTTGRHDMGTL